MRCLIADLAGSRWSSVRCTTTWVARIGALILLSLCASRGNAQTLIELASFNGSNGQNSQAGLTLSGNILYGTTAGGGDNGFGTVFSVPVSGGSPTVLASFNGGNGQTPWAGLTLSGNTLYGTTEAGGANGGGTVFSVPLSGGSPTVLALFNFSNGENPEAGLTLSGNTLYGTAWGGGPNGVGTVFSVPVSGGSPAVLTSFNNSNGSFPEAGLTLSSDGNILYGTTFQGGADGFGTVFSVPVGGGGPTVLASFNGSSGAFPHARLTLSGNTLYGTTEEGGNLSLNGGYGYGTVFSVPVGGGSPTVLASFNGSNGEYPLAGLTLSGNALYGTTNGGGANGDGTIFSLNTDGSGYTDLFDFNGSNGAYPRTDLTLIGSTLYGTTAGGGAYNDGTVVALLLTPTPEPTTFVLLVAGALGLLCYTWRRRVARAA